MAERVGGEPTAANDASQSSSVPQTASGPASRPVVSWAAKAASATAAVSAPPPPPRQPAASAAPALGSWAAKAAAAAEGSQAAEQSQQAPGVPPPPTVSAAVPFAAATRAAQQQEPEPIPAPLPPGGRRVIIDAGAAIRLQRLERLGSELYTTSGVLAEIKDEKARALLGTLPVDLQVKECLAVDLAYVKQFAKCTGDFGFLSSNDMELMALTVQLHREAGGTVRSKPRPLAHETITNNFASFDWAPKRTDADGAPVCSASAALAPEAPYSTLPPTPVVPEALAALAEGSEETACDPAVDPSGAAAAQDESDDSGDEEQELGSDEDGSSGGEWVTSQNMHRFGVNVQTDSDIGVTCATADYSVQNVLLQMGITPLTFDGYAIRTVKMWGLICRACFAFTRETHKVFCPKCGHDTLVRVPVVVDQDGTPRALNNGRKLRTKGTVFSEPKYDGGRGWKPIMSEDQMMIGGRDREFRRLANLHDKDKMSRDVFNQDNGSRGWWQRNTTRTGKTITGEAPRVVAGYGRFVNPNANNFRGFKALKSKKR